MLACNVHFNINLSLAYFFRMLIDDSSGVKYSRWPNLTSVRSDNKVLETT
jgi:hypothetical protein